jgi:hypothetical protein
VLTTNNLEKIMPLSLNQEETILRKLKKIIIGKDGNKFSADDLKSKLQDISNPERPNWKNDPPLFICAQAERIDLLKGCLNLDIG